MLMIKNHKQVNGTERCRFPGRMTGENDDTDRSDPAGFFNTSCQQCFTRPEAHLSRQIVLAIIEITTIFR